jgi:hypothetical protein
MSESKIERKCDNCGTLLVRWQKRFCSIKCHFDYVKRNYKESPKIPREVRTCPECKSTFNCRITERKKYCSYACFNKFRSEKTFEEFYGKEQSKIMKHNLSTALKKAKYNCNGQHYEEILRQAKILEEEGFRCIPIGKVIPDIVAVRDGKIFAIEVEKGKRPNWNKYTDDIRKFYDDIIWILLRKDKRTVTKG